MLRVEDIIIVRKAEARNGYEIVFLIIRLYGV